MREAADLIIGNLNEDGYLIASDDELLGVAPPASPEADAVTAKNIVSEAQALGLAESLTDPVTEGVDPSLSDSSAAFEIAPGNGAGPGLDYLTGSSASESNNRPAEASFSSRGIETAAAVAPAPEAPKPAVPTYKANFSAADLQEALDTVQQLDPPGVGCRDLRGCLLSQLRYHQQQLALHKNGNGTAQILQDATAIVDQHLRAVQNKQHKEISKAIGRPLEAVQQALEVTVEVGGLVCCDGLITPNCPVVIQLPKACKPLIGG